MLRITVTTEHIAAARPYSNSSPIALALQGLGYANATCNHRYAYFDGKVCELPEVAIANEIKFDFIAKSGQVQGEVLEQIEAYEFEITP